VRGGSNGATSARAGSLHAGEHQRARMLRAMVEVVSERGYGGASVTLLVTRARASRKMFYEQFEGFEDCFLAAFEEAIGRMADIAASAYEGEGTWSDRIRTALEALMGFVEHERAIGSLVFVQALRAGPAVQERRARTIEMLRVIVDEGQSQNSPGGTPPRLTAETVVGGAIAIIQARLTQAKRAQMMTLVNPLMSVIVQPYLGPAAAVREGGRPTPKVPTPARVLGARVVETTDPLADLHMRVTYRTLRVLVAVREHPGACSREIGDAAGMTDQGQISKILARLENHGLICNPAERPRTGRHGWYLTERGKEVERTVRPGLRAGSA
jgi:AcrR family transcriptional regulator/DNA-binding MarR family transcriptional regulator